MRVMGLLTLSEGSVAGHLTLVLEAMDCCNGWFAVQDSKTVTCMIKKHWQYHTDCWQWHEVMLDEPRSSSFELELPCA